MLLHPEKNAVWKGMTNGSHDAFIYEKLSTMKIPQGCIVWDIGAHHGFHTLGFAAIVNKVGGKVLAFEPNPFNVQRLRKNIEYNTQISNQLNYFSVQLVRGRFSF